MPRSLSPTTTKHISPILTRQKTKRGHGRIQSKIDSGIISCLRKANANQKKKNRSTTQPREFIRCLRNAVDRAQGRRGTSRALHRCIDPSLPHSLMVASLAWSLWWPVSVSCETDVPECRKPLWRILHLRRRRTESTSQIPRRKTSRNLCPESEGSPPVERGGDDVVQLFRLFRRWRMPQIFPARWSAEAARLRERT